MKITKDLIRKLPKTDLHLHLDGSIRLETLIDLAKKEGVELPSYTPEGLKKTVFKENYESLEDYLKGFGYTTKVMRTRKNIERVSYELALDNQNEGVRYIEVRFAPQLHATDNLSLEDSIVAVNDGLKRAKEEFNQREVVRNGDEPGFEYGIIVCAMRYFNQYFSDYFADMVTVHKYLDEDEVFGLASLEVVGAAVEAKRKHNLPVVGVDLAGPERGNPPVHHREAYMRAQRNFLNKTVHAGEAYGPESIFQAITELGADRIGHGTSLFKTNSVTDSSIHNKEKYVHDLVQFIANRRITIEVCLTSNKQTDPDLNDLRNHPFKEMIKNKLSCSICTDNRTVSHTTVTDEVYKAVQAFDLTLHDIKTLMVYGFKRSFFPLDYRAKRTYVRSCMNYFDKIVKENS